MKNHNFVIQDWLGELTYKQQTVLLVSLRGPDINQSKTIKKFVKFIRNTVLINADPNSNFIEEGDLPTINEIKNEDKSILDDLSVHYFSHLLQSLNIISKKHPNKKIKQIALDSYLQFVNVFLHLNIETEEELDIRLIDKGPK